MRWNEHLHLDAEGRQVGSFDYRAVARAESSDFSRFPEPTKVLEPDFSRSADDDLAGGGLYNSAAIKYPCAANSYFIFTSAYHHSSDTLDVQLATSRDGIGFTRWRTPFVRLGPAGAFDAKGLYMAGGIVAGDDELYLYYGGVSTRHDIDVDAKRSGDARPAAIGRLRLRRDGFVSQDAEGERASLTTVPFELAGDRLQVNMDASSRGWLQVEILDASGHALWGYAAADADRLMANEVDRTVTWNGTSDLSALRGRHPAALPRELGEALRIPGRLNALPSAGSHDGTGTGGWWNEPPDLRPRRLTQTLRGGARGRYVTGGEPFRGHQMAGGTVAGRHLGQRWFALPTHLLRERATGVEAAA